MRELDIVEPKGENRGMKDKDTVAPLVFERVEHWPPYTYRDYPDVTPETLSSFINFLGTENTNDEKKQLQPWIPFCGSKCTFCYFPGELQSKGNIGEYISALKKTLKVYAETRYVGSSEFGEIYFGGGTPSVVSCEQIADLLLYCTSNFNLSSDRKVKVTGCTSDFDEKKLKSMLDFGVDQLDLGIQTFDDGIRKMINLRDNAGEAERTVRTARKLGLSVSIDLMYNLPGQTLEVWRKDLQKTIELGVESVDCYPLDVYPDTKLARQLQTGEVPPIGGSDAETKMYLEAHHTFLETGYKPACHNRFSRLTEDLMEPCREILGTGSGFFMGHLGKYSYVDVEPADAYVNVVKSRGFPLAKLSLLSEDDEMRKMMLRLYIRLPVDKEKFRSRFGSLPEEVFPKVINRLKQKGLIEVDSREIRLTKMGDAWRANIAWEFAQA